MRACAYIGADPADFKLTNRLFLQNPRHSIHGIGHIYRTMTACALLGERLQKPRVGLLAFCGAYIHDLARIHDWADPAHGKRAIDRFFHRFDALWDRYELTEKERQFVRDAVTQHSTDEWMQADDEGYDVMAILKDADALDRCRLGDGGLDPHFLRYPQSRELIGTIADCYVRTRSVRRSISFTAFIEFVAH